MNVPRNFNSCRTRKKIQINLRSKFNIFKDIIENKAIETIILNSFEKTQDFLLKVFKLCILETIELLTKARLFEFFLTSST